MVKRNFLDRPLPRSVARFKEAPTSPYKVYTDRPNARIELMDKGLVGFENTNVIIRSRRHHCPCGEHIGPLSIFFVSKGQEACEIDGRRFVLDESAYLIHNLGQRVSGETILETEVDSLVIGFWPGFAEDVLRSLTTPTDQLLDTPKESALQPVQFFNQLYPHDKILSPALFRLRASLESDTVHHGWLEEQNHLLLERLLYVHRNIRNDIESVPAIRASTRTEIYQRLHRARDFMEANLDRPVTIIEIASAAWFSPHHFLRLFKQVFHETPHQYLIRRRLERAQRLLIHSDIPITDICFSVGFESPGSFSWLFRQRIGQSPEQFRRLHRAHDSRK
ncbi:MAG TPA: AraC family transcriptional regulator [Chthonomonadaceae bacterium]|nr:AraC family transcriptional regulator [Chthonomonadaceae bacterium]